MQIRREEIRTGLLVVVSITILTAVLLAIGAPGVFRPTNTYRIYFDNAAGLNQGAPVLLAGRRIGQVTSLISPVPMSERPKGFENDETLVQVEVDRSAEIYNKVQVHMVQTSLLGQPVIDFTNGDETSGLATACARRISRRPSPMRSMLSRIPSPPSPSRHRRPCRNSARRRTICA
jgi:phospholipid/cholesterol/gamma-HCH transport system substrate-binding protein